MIELLKAYNAYLDSNEFSGEPYTAAELEALGDIIPLSYTTSDNGTDLQVSYDKKKECLYYYYGDDIIQAEFINYKEFVKNLPFYGSIELLSILFKYSSYKEGGVKEWKF